MPTPPDSVYRQIPLTQGQYALVDPEDYERLSVHKWQAQWCKGTETFYASRKLYLDGKRRSLGMHREVLNLDFSDLREGEHRNPLATLDNRKSNLRVATRAQNMSNIRRHRNSKSGFKGVSWHKHTGKWQAQIEHNYQNIYLGIFLTPEEAHAAYCAAAVRLKGEFARVV